MGVTAFALRIVFAVLLFDTLPDGTLIPGEFTS